MVQGFWKGEYFDKLDDEEEVCGLMQPSASLYLKFLFRSKLNLGKYESYATMVVEHHSSSSIYFSTS